MNRRKVEVEEMLTGYRFGNNGGMVVTVVARVEIMVVQSPVQPVIQKFDRTGVQ